MMRTQFKFKKEITAFTIAIWFLLTIPVVQRFVFQTTNTSSSPWLNHLFFAVLFLGLIFKYSSVHWVSRIIALLLFGAATWLLTLSNLNNGVFVFLLAGLLLVIHMFQERPDKRLAICIPFILCFFAVEIGFVVIGQLARTNAGRYVHSGPAWDVDPDVGARPIASNSYLETKFIDDSLIYKDIPYETDGKGRRKCGDIVSSASCHLVLMGCSFTWGDGVILEETLAYKLKEAFSPHCNVYNYAIPGAGSGEMLVQLKKPELFDDISENDGFCIYAIMPDHLRRSTYNFHRILSDSKQQLFFKLSTDDELLGPMNFQDDLYLDMFTRVIMFLYKFSPVSRFCLYQFYPTPYRESTVVRINLEIINEMQQAYEKMFEGKFVVMLWHDQKTAYAWQLFKEKLQKIDIPVIMIPDSPDPLGLRLHKYDPHPNKHGHQWATEHLQKALKKL